MIAFHHHHNHHHHHHRYVAWLFVIVTLLLIGCRSTDSKSTNEAASPCRAEFPDSTELIINATGFVTRRSDGTIVLDAPELMPNQWGRPITNEYTHFEVPADSHVAKTLNDALVKGKVTDFPYLPKLQTNTDQTTVHVARLIFSTRHSEATRFSPVVATIRARVIRVRRDERDSSFTFGGRTFDLYPLEVLTILEPHEMTEWMEVYRASIAEVAGDMYSPRGSLDRLRSQLEDVRAFLVKKLGGEVAAPGYEVFRFIDDLLRDVKKAAAAAERDDVLGLAPALREHAFEDGSMTEVERPYLVDAERHLLRNIDRWIHDRAAAAFQAEKGATPRAKELGALVIRADNLTLGPRHYDDGTFLPPRIISTAAKNARRRFPDLDPNQK